MNFYGLTNKKLKIIYRIVTVILVIFWAFFASGTLYRWGLRNYVYPLDYKDEIFTAADSYDLDRALVFSVVKIESGFNKDAESESGAVGLMQITPSTGKYIADMLKLSNYDLKDEHTNVNFGCFYLKYLLSKFENTETAVCSYNAGEGNVTLWLLNADYSDDGITLKNIPFPETREYIKNFKKTFENYKKLYGYLLTKKEISSNI